MNADILYEVHKCELLCVCRLIPRVELGHKNILNAGVIMLFRASTLAAYVCEGVY